jgi:hypothetical protein
VQQQLKNYILFIILIAVFVTPSFALAAWWNPFSWGFWNSIFHRQNNIACTQEAKLCPDGSYVGRKGPKCEFADCPKLIGGDKDSHGCLIAAGYSWCETKNKCLRTWEEKCEAVINAEVLKNLTLSYPNPYDTAKTDTIKLVNGKTVIYDAGNIKPRGYNVATTAIGDLDGDGISDGVIGIYQSYGANIITPIIFVFSNKNGVLTQTDSVLPDSSAWNYETQIKSLSIDNGVISVNLLVLAAKDQSLPHYQQQPTVAKIVQYKLVNGKLVLQPVDQTAGWKTYNFSGSAYLTKALSFKYPPSWDVSLVTGEKDIISIIIDSPDDAFTKIIYTEVSPSSKITCDSLKNNATAPVKIFCKTVESMPYYVIYKNDAVLNVYNQILSTFKFTK